jgi:hypothetical protein
MARAGSSAARGQAADGRQLAHRGQWPRCRTVTQDLKHRQDLGANAHRARLTSLIRIPDRVVIGPGATGPHATSPGLSSQPRKLGASCAIRELPAEGSRVGTELIIIYFIMAVIFAVLWWRFSTAVNGH